MNIAVINLRDILKYIIKIGFSLLIFVFIIKLFSIINIKKQEENIKNRINTRAKQIKEYSFLGCLDMSISLMSYSKDSNKDIQKILAFNDILGMQLRIIDNVVNDNYIQEDIEELILENEEELEAQQSTNQIEEVKENNIPAKHTNIYEKVEINNQSDYELTEEILTPNIELTDKKDILIYHTHTCESYTPSTNYLYEMTGNYRTTDLNYTVARVGTELANYLNEKGFNAIHDTTYHDYPTYSGSYDRSLNTVQSLLNGKDTQIVIDLHRDAVGSSSSYAPKVKINGEYAAQIMFVIGTDGGRIKTS